MRAKRKLERKNKQRCYSCNRIHTVENPVKYRMNPYSAEIYEDYSKHWMCNNCAYESAQDI